uniref:Uncharacterized protein n=1 Tax=Pithovirus LCPAC102 TaxID=2506587 RepID=A0A4D5XFT5_9VIRU|nr:MAG: uncharacterized protein LCPAC102_01800 [Pithovirus LCPAC102]
MLFALNERGIRDPNNYPEIISKYSIIIDETPYYTLENAYMLAKNERIALKQNIKYDNYELTEHDLIQIAQYNPKVDWKIFCKLKEKDMKYFMTEYPELKSIENNIDLNDAFYYAMNAITPSIEYNDWILQRQKIYNKVEYIGQTLLLELYGTIDNYLNAIPLSIFESYILVFDKYAGDLNMIMNISDRMGISLNPNITKISTDKGIEDNISILDQLYIQLSGIFKIIVIKNNKDEYIGIRETFYIENEEISLEYIININYIQFIILFKKIGLAYDETAYINRLILFISQYK